MTEVFFYGLFMDRTLLLQKGIRPANPRKGYLNNYALQIGNRASLLPSQGERAYGMVMSLAEDALQKLYSEVSVADYVPEIVDVITDTGQTVSATCYNLPAEFLTGTNAAYAQSLYALAQQEGFPDDYLEHIRKVIESNSETKKHH